MDAILFTTFTDHITVRFSICSLLAHSNPRAVATELWLFGGCTNGCYAILLLSTGRVKQHLVLIGCFSVVIGLSFISLCVNTVYKLKILASHMLDIV